MGSGLKRLATVSVSKRYQTSLFAQLSKTILETYTSTIFVKCLIFEEAPSKNTRYGEHLPKENGIKQQINSVSRRAICEETSVDSC